jgi:hypothetical protein
MLLLLIKVMHVNLKKKRTREKLSELKNSFFLLKINLNMALSKLLKSSILGVTVLIVGGSVYFTILTYLKRKKCQHIPGPVENG